MPPNNIPDETQLDSERNQDVQIALRNTVWNSLKPFVTVMTLLFAFFSVSHLILLPLDIRAPMAALAGGSAVTYFCLGVSVLRVSYFEKFTYPIVSSVLLLASLNSTIHLYLSADIVQSTNAILVIFGAGFFILSTPWFFATIFITLTSWFYVVASLTDQELLVHFAFALFSSTVASIVFHFIHVRDLIDNHGLRLVSEAQGLKLEHLAAHDFLTGLANRRKFLESLELAIDNSKRSDSSVGVLFCDLNDFKIMNDTFGHDFGDEVLCLVAEGLTSAVRKTDLVARFGGDEFAVLLSNVKDPLEINTVISKIEEKFVSYRDVKGHQALIRLSIGKAVSSEDCDDVDELLNLADQRMYQQKQKTKQEETVAL